MRCHGFGLSALALSVDDTHIWAPGDFYSNKLLVENFGTGRSEIVQELHPEVVHELVELLRVFQ